MAETETAKPINIVGENNEFVVSDVKEQTVIPRSETPEQVSYSPQIKNSSIVDSAVQARANEVKQTEKQPEQQQERKKEKKKIELPTFNITSLEKKAFITALTQLFTKQLTLKDLNTTGKKTIKNPIRTRYERLQAILSQIITYETEKKYISLSSIDLNNLIPFHDIESEEKKLGEKQKLKKEKEDLIQNTQVVIKKNFDKKLSDFVSKLQGEVRVLNTEIQNITRNIAQSKDKLFSFEKIIDYLKKNTNLNDFNKLLEQTTQKRLLYKNILYMLIYRPANRDIEKLQTALSLTSLTNSGGKRKTQKNKLKSKRTRSIKKSKKNSTRRK
jgi:hypothetical protein